MFRGPAFPWCPSNSPVHRAPTFMLAMADPMLRPSVRCMQKRRCGSARWWRLRQRSDALLNGLGGRRRHTPATSHLPVTDPHTQDHGVGEGATPEAFSDLFEDMSEDVEGLLAQLRSVDSDKDSQRILRRAVHHAESERDRLFMLWLVGILVRFRGSPLRKHRRRQGEQRSRRESGPLHIN